MLAVVAHRLCLDLRLSPASEVAAFTGHLNVSRVIAASLGGQPEDRFEISDRLAAALARCYAAGGRTVAKRSESLRHHLDGPKQVSSRRTR